MYRITPICAMMPRVGRDIRGQDEVLRRPAKFGPSSDGPSMMPATISPITRGWPK